MIPLYEEIKKRLDKIEYQKLWPGFHQYKFALYTSETVWFEERQIPWDNRFLGNTAIPYEGEFIAIWDIEHDPGDDLDVMASLMIHEMFHAFQMEMGEERFPDDLELCAYSEKLQQLQCKFQENVCLSQACKAETVDECRKLLNSFYGIRMQRMKTAKSQVVCEGLVETSEGMAEYVGMKALRQMSEEKYQRKLLNYADVLARCNEVQLELRKISYQSGAILLTLAEKTGINVHHSIAGEKRAVYEILADQMQPDLSQHVMEKEQLKAVFLADQKKKEQQIAAFLEQPRNMINGTFVITGYDPMNQFRIGNQMFVTHFVRLEDERSGESYMLMGKTLLQMKGINRVTAYQR